MAAPIDKARENRARTKAQRLGLILRRSHSRSEDSPDYGLYRLLSVSARGRENPQTGWLDLDGIERELDR